MEKLPECSGWINGEESSKFLGNTVLVETGVQQMLIYSKNGQNILGSLWKAEIERILVNGRQTLDAL